ncbi:MAG: hypothetical protein QME66_02825 [Candidatus Eisenbacteria bacterium]|nr:hypothetical protein [Candidatus Eisenbacteria bacterium]
MFSFWKTREWNRPIFLKLILILTLLWVSSAIPAFGQNQDSKDKITVFSGGKMDMDFSFSSSVLYGIGSTGNTFGGGIGTLSPGSAHASLNPAGLAFLRQAEGSVDCAPRLKPSLSMVSRFFDVQKRINEGVDSALTDLRTPETEVSYPEVGAAFGQEGGVYSGSVAFPLYGFGFGAALSEPFSLKMKFIETGMEVQFETEKTIGDETKPIGFKAMIDLNVLADVSVNVTSVSIGRSLLDNIGLGAGLSRYDGYAFFDGKARVDGLMSYSGQEFIFNNPNDDWHNDLNQSAWASFKGKAWGKKLGASYRMGNRLSLDALYEDLPDILLTGSMNVVENKVPALNTEGGDDILDPTKLDIAKLTLTEFIENRTSDSLSIHLPSSFKIGSSIRLGFITTTVTYATYTGQFGYSFLGQTRGVEPKRSVGLGLDFSLLKLGAVVTWADEVRQGTDDDAGRKTNLLLPSASIGFGMPLRKGLRVDSTVLAVPAPLGRVSFSMSF